MSEIHIRTDVPRMLHDLRNLLNAMNEESR